ncbi:MAG: hypothetical protein OXK79_12255 [Chloroflexota bacterium]|nr:hypothetical protein [Chloroflexota bacterium]
MEETRAPTVRKEIEFRVRRKVGRLVLIMVLGQRVDTSTRTKSVCREMPSLA